MRTRLITLVAATLTAALLGTSASYLTEPVATAQTTTDPTVHGEARNDGRSVHLHTDLGSLRVTNQRLEITDPNNVVLSAIPLTFIQNNTAYPIDARVEGGNATLTPRLDQARPVTDDERRGATEAQSNATAEGRATETLIANTSLPQLISASDSPEDRMNSAMGNVNNELTVALAVGTLLGAIIGGPVGCVALGLLGGAAGGAATVGVATLPAAIGSCLAGAVVGAGMGVVVFNLLIGVPALIASAVHFYNVMTAPPANG